jgi:hypothetical protein
MFTSHQQSLNEHVDAISVPLADWGTSEAKPTRQIGRKTEQDSLSFTRKHIQ